MKTIAIVSQKGGSGKTTVAVHLAVCAELAGQTAAIIDLDPQASAVEWSSRRKAENPEVIRATPEQIPKLLSQAKANGAGFAIIDTAPHSDRAATVAAGLADLILIPCRPAAFDVSAIPTTLDILKLAKVQSRAVILLNAVPPQGKTGEEAAEGLAPLARVAPVRLVHRAAYSHAVNDGRSVEEFEPQGKAADEIRALYHWIMTA
jgi:chromosome partitioning protein